MLRNSDRFASRAARNLPPIGEKFRLPLCSITKAAHPILNPVYRHSWTIESYGAGQSAINSKGHAHLVTIRRLADGKRETIAQHWIAAHLDL